MDAVSVFNESAYMENDTQFSTSEEEDNHSSDHNPKTSANSLCFKDQTQDDSNDEAESETKKVPSKDNSGIGEVIAQMGVAEADQTLSFEGDETFEDTEYNKDTEENDEELGKQNNPIEQDDEIKQNSPQQVKYNFEMEGSQKKPLNQKSKYSLTSKKPCNDTITGKLYIHTINQLF